MTVNVLAYDSISLNCIWMMCFFTDADNKILFSAKKKNVISENDKSNLSWSVLT